MSVFFLGTHQPHWLFSVGVPLFVSRRTLCERKGLKRALAPWALDSGGFTELSMFGEWRTGIAHYIGEVKRWASEIGSMVWAACQDWMCEPFILDKTKLTVAEHQKRTIDNYLELRSREPDLPWVPVLQGWSMGEYEDHAEQYERRGVDLRKLPTVGLGSVCRRQNTMRVACLIRTLAKSGIRLHGFGFKLGGLAEVGDVLESSDSLAWSFAARRQPPLPGHTHKNCANCVTYALQWRDRVLDVISGSGRQGVLF